MVMERTLRCIADNIAAGWVDWLSICLIRIVVENAGADVVALLLHDSVAETDR